ncbi:MAG: glycosyltransferase family 4 protein [Nitrospira sp.]|nr:glycosyltransferase family 4 protein [Nitrospira sp.]
MRFCMVTTFYPPYHFGGDATFVQALARALVARGHHVEVVHCEDAYRLQKEEASVTPTESDDIVVHRLHSPLGLLSPLITQQTGRPGLKSHKLHAILERDFDVVNFHNISLVGGPGVLGMSKAPVNLYTLHEHWLLCPTHIFWKNRQRACDSLQCIRCSIRSGIPPQLWRYTGLIERSLAKVDALLAPSEYTAERHRAAGFEVPIHLLPLFASLEPGSSVNDALPSRPYFLYVGRVTASKGVAVLVEDFLALRDYDLFIVGDGDLRVALQRQYADYPHIRFLGPLLHNQLAPLYRKATALILPSLAPESFGLTVIEAFARGTPAIVHAAGGNREAIGKAGGGYIYESRTELHQAILAIAADPQLRERLGECARKAYAQHYSETRYLEHYLGLVEDIRNKKGVAQKIATPTQRQEGV